MRKWYTYIMIAVLGIFGFLGVFEQRAVAGEAHPGIYDDAGLLSDEEEEALSSEIQTIEAEKTYHVLVVTTEDTQGKDTAAYADDFFEEHNGDGTAGSGILFLIDMQNRQVYISTGGETVIRAFTDKKIDMMLDRIYEAVSAGEYYQSCEVFLEEVSSCVPVEEGKETSDGIPVWVLLLGSIVIGRVIVFFMTRRRGGKVVAGVNNYFDAGAAREIIHEDRYMNRVITKRKIEKHNDDDGPKKMGGSSVHRSSGGTTHGGGGRGF